MADFNDPGYYCFTTEETQIPQDVLEGRHSLAGHVELATNPLLKSNKKLLSNIARDFRASVIKNFAVELDEKVRAGAHHGFDEDMKAFVS